MTTFPLQAIFNRGELTPVLHSRIDLEYFKMAYKYGENFVVTRHGGLMNRPGTKFLGTIRDQSKKARFVKFVFSRSQVYQIEFGENYIRFWASDGQVVSATSPISGISKANPGVVTYTGADNVANGDHIKISGVQGMTQVNNVEFTVAGLNAGANTFQLAGGVSSFLMEDNSSYILLEDGSALLNESGNVDTTGYGTYMFGGLISKIYEIATTYTETEVAELQFAQSNDVIYIAHKNHLPAKLQRFSETNWTLSDVVFFDGPYLPSPDGTHAQVTLSTNGGPGAVTSVIRTSDSNNAIAVYDQDEHTDYGLGTGFPLTIRFTWAAAKVLNNYIILGPVGSGNADNAPKNWYIRAANVLGGPWTTLDARSNSIGWQSGEARYFEFFNETAYTIYEFVVAAHNGGGDCKITEIYWGQNGDFASAITMTFSNTSGINSGLGFQASDVGRPIRIFNSNDAKWRWFKITAVTDTTHVNGRFYGFALRDNYNISEWQLGAFSVQSGWPACVAFYLDRLCWGRTNQKPLGLYLSQIGAYENHSVSAPLLDDDAITINIASNQTEEILWLSEGIQDLIIGTSVAVRTMGKADSGKAFSPSNFSVVKRTNNGSSPIIPALIDSTLIYPSYHAKSLREFLYSFEVDSYVSPEVSILSDHLLKTGIVLVDYAQAPEPILWIVNGDGELIGLTYDKENKIVGMHRQRVSGTYPGGSTWAKVESLSTIPGLSQDDTWIIVQRFINGSTKRYVERLTEYPDDETLKEDAWYLDCAVQYNGIASNSFSGLLHLRGQTVSIYANNTVYANLVVGLDGIVSLPGGVTTTKAVIGLAQSQYFDLLQPVMETPDGISFNRKKHSIQTLIDVHRTKGLKVGTSRKQERLQYKVGGSRTENPEELFTGFCKVHYDSRWDDLAGMRIVQDKPYPAFIRSIMLVNDGEPV